MYLLEIFFLVNLTPAVYISSIGCTLTFGAKSEGSLTTSPFSPDPTWPLVRAIILNVDL